MDEELDIFKIKAISNKYVNKKALLHLAIVLQYYISNESSLQAKLVY